MKNSISTIKTKTSKDLKEIIFQIWNKIAEETINNLLASLFQSLQLVLLSSRKSIQNFLRNKIASTNFVMFPVPETVKIINDIKAGLEDLDDA